MEIADVEYLTGKILRRYLPGAMVDERVAMITTVAGTCTGPCGLASVRYTSQRADSETGLMYYRAR